MARASKTASQSNTADETSAKGAGKRSGAKGKAAAKDAQDRVALKEASKNKGSRGKASEPEPEPEPEPTPRIFDSRTKRDIGAVCLGVLAVVLFLIVALPSSGVVTSVLSQCLRLLLGIGAYLLPFMLIAIVVCLLWRTEREGFALRVGVGLVMLLLAFMMLMSVFTPSAASDPSVILVPSTLILRGGYVGGGIAWALVQLFGVPIAAVVAGGIALGGAVIIGFSISGAIEALREKGAAARERRRTRAEEEYTDDVLPAPPYPPAAGASYDEAPEAEPRRAPVREERGLVAGFPTGGTMYEPEEEPQPSAHQARIRREVKPRVPRDLSRPRPASSSLSTQLLGSSSGDLGGPNATSPDAYWPADYAFHEGDEAYDFSQGTGSASAPTQLLGHDENTSVSALPWEEPFGACAADADTLAAEPDANAPDATVAFTRDEAFAHTTSASAARPMTRRLGGSSASRTAAAAATGAAAGTAAGAAVAAGAGAASSSRSRSSKKSASSAPVTRAGFTLPAFSLIKHTERATAADEAGLAEVAGELQGTLEDFGIMATVAGWVAGPTVTLFKIDLPSGVRVSRITALQDDIALALAAPGVRIFAPIPGTNYVGIEVPNRERQTVLLGDVLKDAKGGPLEIAIGKDVEGRSVVSDLSRMPHLLIGGTTGSGKSVAINAMIMSILMRATPDEVRFIMIDPKRVEFTPYNGIPHLYVPVVTENKDAASALAWGVAEMEKRLKTFSKVGVRNIGQYNDKVAAGELDAPDASDDAEPVKKLPYIVIVIDELADLMMNVGKEVELSISRIAQLARAAGIHLIVATQRPSTNVVTGLIKANITNRIAFNVASGIDSRVILDTPGAENLIGLGDMLFSKPEYAKPQRLQGCFVSESEIAAVVEHLKEQGEPEYHTEILQTNVMGLGSTMPDGSGGSVSSDDPLLWEAADIVVSSGLGSTSNIQRRLSVGYSRAGRIMDQLAEKGIVGPPNGSKPREVLVDEMELETLKAFEAHDVATDY